VTFDRNEIRRNYTAFSHSLLKTIGSNSLQKLYPIITSPFYEQAVIGHASDALPYSLLVMMFSQKNSSMQTDETVKKESHLNDYISLSNLQCTCAMCKNTRTKHMGLLTGIIKEAAFL
jgi:hypothetical protein